MSKFYREEYDFLMFNTLQNELTSLREAKRVLQDMGFSFGLDKLRQIELLEELVTLYEKSITKNQ